MSRTATSCGSDTLNCELQDGLGTLKSVVLTWGVPHPVLATSSKLILFDCRGFLLASEPATELGASHLFFLDLTAPQPGMSIFADGETELREVTSQATQGEWWGWCCALNLSCHQRLCSF